MCADRPVTTPSESRATTCDNKTWSARCVIHLCCCCCGERKPMKLSKKGPLAIVAFMCLKKKNQKKRRRRSTWTRNPTNFFYLRDKVLIKCLFGFSARVTWIAVSPPAAVQIAQRFGELFIILACVVFQLRRYWRTCAILIWPNRNLCWGNDWWTNFAQQ